MNENFKIIPFNKDSSEESLKIFVEMISPLEGIEYWRWLAMNCLQFNNLIESSYEELGYDEPNFVNMILASKASVAIAGYLKYVDMGYELVLNERETALFEADLLEDLSWFEFLCILGLSLSKKEIVYKPFFEAEVFQSHMIGFYKLLHVYFQKGRIDRAKIYPASELN